MKRINISLFLFALVFIYSCTSQKKEKLDPLPSWNEGITKQAIFDYVEDVTNKNSINYVKPANRIATFDNDGTLWSEQPLYFQFQFVIDRVKAMAPDHPEWDENPLLKAALDGDINAVFSFGEHALMELVMISSTGMTTDEFSKLALEWINTAKHPTKELLYKEMVYQPMLELLDYLRTNDFKTYIVSGGGIEFMRPWAEERYGIPPEQVIGSSVKNRFEMTDSGPVLIRLPEIDFFNDKGGKPVAIEKFIGKKPIFAAGNSDGDLQMLQWTDSKPYPSFQLYIHHTDAEREWAYDRDSHIGKLDKGLDEANRKGWTVVDMARDWKLIYPAP